MRAAPWPIVTTAIIAATGVLVCQTRADEGGAGLARHWPVPEHYKLSNGLEVVLEANARASDVAVIVSYDIGTLDDPARTPDVAELARGMTLRGSRHLPAGRLAAYLDAWGATQVGASVATDSTTFSEVVPPAQLERVLWLESERMAFTLEAMDLEGFRREFRAVTTRTDYGGPWRDELEDALQGLVLPSDHALRLENRPMKARHPTLDDVRAFFQRGYRPDNAVLAIAGNFDREATRSAIEKYFAPIGNPGPISKRAPMRSFVFAGAAEMSIAVGADRDGVAFGWTVPRSVRTSMAAALELLYLALIDAAEQQVLRQWRDANSIGVWFTPIGDARLLWLTVRLRKGADCGVFVKALGDMVAGLARAPLPEETLATLRRRAEWNLLFGSETTLQRAQILVSARRAEYASFWLEPEVAMQALRSVQADTLQQLARDLLVPTKRFTLCMRASDGRAASPRNFKGDLRPRFER